MSRSKVLPGRAANGGRRPYLPPATDVSRPGLTPTTALGNIPPAQAPSPRRLGYGGICRAAQPGPGAEEIGGLSPRGHRPASWEEANPGRRLPGDRTNALTLAGDALRISSATNRTLARGL